MDLRQFLERYGIALGVVAGLALVVALLPGNADDRLRGGSGGDLVASGEGFEGGDGDGAGFDSSGSGAAGGAAGGTRTGGGAGGTGVRAGSGATGGGAGATGGGGGAGGAGGLAFGEGPNCRADGRQAGISFYMPPCVRWDGGDNGGETAMGVAGDKVLIARWVPDVDPGTRAILQGARLSDSPQAVKRAYETLFRYSNQHYETYGREVVFVDVPASGSVDNDEAMKADALKIAREVKPFAVIDGDPAEPIPTVLARELAQLGVLCLCTTSNTSEFYKELPPLIFSSLPTMSEYAAHTAEYIGKRLLGRNAEFAGDDNTPTQDYRSRPRKFGLIYIEGRQGKVDPEMQRAGNVMLRELARYGVDVAVKRTYIYEPGRNQQDVTNMIASMKGAGVTTIIPIWDPLYPILITREATNQQYFPEWFIVGTGLSDTTTAGRLYDELQWRQAFGISPLWVTWADVTKSAGYREYKHADPGGDPGVLINIYRARIATLFRGIHMAGPNLTHETFARGLYAYPATGGTPGLPLVAVTRDFPTEIKDFTEVWWGADEQGPDERGEQGSGMMMKANGGRRYRLGQWPESPAQPYVREGAIAVSDNPEGGGDPDHEGDGHTHPPDRRCLSCS